MTTETKNKFIEIKHKITGKVLLKAEAETLREADLRGEGDGIMNFFWLWEER